jgi:UDP-N-acetyl-2-amino-2-deoxyglucuronate dehydrogenase
MSDPATIRFAVLGAGVIGELHAQTIKSLAPRAELTAVIDAVPERAQQLADKHGVQAFTSLEDALASDDIDAVTIGTPSGMHADQAVAVLEAGKHVIVEKPLDINLEAARRVLDAEKRSSATAMVVSQRRHGKANQIAHEAAQSGKFGKLTSGFATMQWWRSQGYYDSGDWRGTWALDGGGALMNQGIHAIDLFVWFMGEPVEVHAWTGCLAHERIEVEDTAVATVRFANGALGTVHGTTAAYPGMTQRVAVHGDRGSAIVENDKLIYFHAAAPADGSEQYAYGAGGKANQAEEIMPQQEPYKPASANQIAGLEATSHTAQFEDFLDAVAEKRSPLVTVSEAAKTLALIRGIYESARLGKPIKIEELEK